MADRFSPAAQRSALLDFTRALGSRDSSRANVIRELTADARNIAAATSLVLDRDWPARAVTMRMLDLDGREVHSAIKAENKWSKPNRSEND